MSFAPIAAHLAHHASAARAAGVALTTAFSGFAASAWYCITAAATKRQMNLPARHLGVRTT
jgi:hypothetical protein